MTDNQNKTPPDKSKNSMKSLLIYYSMSGNTKEISEAIHAGNIQKER